MCGFAGWLRTGGAQHPGQRTALLARMGAQLARRGPDAVSSYDDGRLAMVFRRLAINDAQSGGQPIHDESGNRIAAVNGEIYNHRQLRRQLLARHRLRSDSDCEVVVHLWEELDSRLLVELNGMFGLCLWDRSARRGLLARDRLGIKPLYYAPLPDGLLFASELTALLAHPDCPREPDSGQLDLSYVGSEDYTSAPDHCLPSFVSGVHQLPAGHWLPLSASGDGATGHGKPRQYWSLSDALEAAGESAPRPSRSYIDDYADLLADSIRLQSTSQAEVGAFLSGGLDSSTLVAAVAGSGPSCFSVSEATTIASGDLARAADLTCELGLDFHPVRFDARGFAAQINFGLAQLEEIIWALDGPKFAPELFFKYELHRYAKTARSAVRVMLLGQGADEFAGGYSHSLTSPRATWADYERQLPEPAPGHVPGSVRGAAGRTSFQLEMVRRLTVLQNHNLWHEDRVAAAQGIEARVPFLDHRLIEFLAAIPPVRHPELFFNKQIVRQAASRWLPQRWQQAPKILFWQARDRSSVHTIMADCVARVYPDFRTAYAADLTVSQRQELDRWYAAIGSNPPGRTATQRLSAAMTWAIFSRLCGELGRGRPAPDWRPSALRPDDNFTHQTRGVASGLVDGGS